MNEIADNGGFSPQGEPEPAENQASEEDDDLELIRSMIEEEDSDTGDTDLFESDEADILSTEVERDPTQLP